jgi:DNA-directed RNA polymerase specialized sigma24 family protein
MSEGVEHAMRSGTRFRLTSQMTFSSFGEHGKVDERILLDAAHGGDERAFGVLLERHRPGLETVCWMMLGDPQHADQAMQETILSAWRQRGLAAASSSVQVWLYRIAVRACMEALEVTCDEFRCRGAFDEGNGDEEPDGL